YRELRRTPRMRARSVGDSPWSRSSTARRRRRSSSAGVPIGLLIHKVRCPRTEKGFIGQAGLSKALVALSIAGVCTAIGGLVIGNDSVYWAGLVLAAPLYLLYVLPMTLLLLGVFTVAAICSFVGKR